MDIAVDLRKEEQDIDDFDAYKVIDIWKTSSTYDEFCIKCDMQDIECIITREEFEAIKPLYGRANEIDATFDVM